MSPSLRGPLCSPFSRLYSSVPWISTRMTWSLFSRVVSWCVEWWALMQCVLGVVSIVIIGGMPHPWLTRWWWVDRVSVNGLGAQKWAFNCRSEWHHLSSLNNATVFYEGSNLLFSQFKLYYFGQWTKCYFYASLRFGSLRSQRSCRYRWQVPMPIHNTVLILSLSVLWKSVYPWQ